MECDEKITIHLAQPSPLCYGAGTTPEHSMDQTLVRIAELTKRGMTPAEIAARLGVGDAWVHAVMGTDAFRVVLENVHEGTQARGQEDHARPEAGD